MPGQLATLIRSKYPGAYDDLDDATLEAQVLAKYPEYKDLTESKTDTAAPKVDPRSQVRLFGGDGDESLGTTIGRAVRDSPIGMLGTAGEKLYGAFKAHPVESLATAGALAAVPLTGGASAGLLPAIAAAGLGGAGGAGLGIIKRQLDTGVPERPLDVAQEMATQGAYQAAGEGAGGLVARGATALAPKIYGAALGASKTLRTKLPNLVQRGLDEGLAITKRGGEQALELMMASKAKADELVAAAEAAGRFPRIKAREVTKGFKELKPPKGSGSPEVAPKLAEKARQIRAELTPPPALPNITEATLRHPRIPPVVESGDEAFLRAQAELGPLARNVPQSVFRPSASEVRAAAELGPTAVTIPRSVLNPPPVPREPITFVSERVVPPRKPAGLSGKESATLVRRLEQEADAAFAAERKGGAVAGLEPQMKKAMAEGIREAQVTRVGQPLKDANQRTRELYGLADAITDTATKPRQLHNLMSGVIGGGSFAATGDPKALLAGLAYRGLLSPAVMSHGAIGLSQLGKTELAQLLRASLLAKLAATSQGKP